MIRRIRQWWAVHEYIRAAEYEKHHIAQAIFWGDERRLRLEKMNEAMAPLVVDVSEPTKPRIVR